jgi:predicted  nucleic acid-binding Zn-ribbon protein
MPHQCTNCERVFPDGSKEMLSGCPDCGGNKFQFKPDSATDPPTLDDEPTREPSVSNSNAESSPSESTESDPATRRSSDATPGTEPAESTTATEPTESTTTTEPIDSENVPTTPGDSDCEYIEAESDPSVLDGPEDTAQADARRDLVSPDELDDAAAAPHTADASRAIPPDSDESPDIDDLRAELNDQFESIKILEPGQYELNLMELYDRQECIISLQEDGHYVIEVADSWGDE